MATYEVHPFNELSNTLVEVAAKHYLRFRKVLNCKATIIEKK